ncbi:MAG: metal-sulfur cluster assembly factor [Chloroflexota bacterium]
MEPPEGFTLISDEAIESEAWARLHEVYDPEIAINLVDLGLIYDLASDHGKVDLTMSLTTPGCPMSDSMPPAVERVLAAIPGVTEASVDLVWDPPWDPDRITDEGRRQLGL